ncbi:MAG TPA: PHB depolymerase family esterase, partial [Myxococcota bacterium]|nr:PHB depolymerase family esterase [Myxococcota bacterium]
ALDDAYVLSPWGRGIIGYRGLAERDIFAALEHAGGLVRFDPNRVYLAGFSMGGAGAWSLALHTPDRWTAVSISSGGTWLTALGVGLGGNARGLPLRIRHGDADGSVAVEEARFMGEELRRNGVDADLKIIAGRGHVFDDAEWREAATWLLSQRRAPQRSFSFVCDNFVHRGRSGVRMRRDTRISPFPKVSCRIEGSTVTIDSRGTPGLDVDLGPEGLGLGGEATLIWNGKRAYRGPPRLVTLGIGAGSR